MRQISEFILGNSTLLTIGLGQMMNLELGGGRLLFDASMCLKKVQAFRCESFLGWTRAMVFTGSGWISPLPLYIMDFIFFPYKGAYPVDMCNIMCMKGWGEGVGKNYGNRLLQPASLPDVEVLLPAPLAVKYYNNNTSSLKFGPDQD